jgi:hypothetical protein
LKITRRNEEERDNLSLSKKEMNEKIQETMKESERRENLVSDLKYKLNEASDGVLAKKEYLEGSASSLAEAKHAVQMS